MHDLWCLFRKNVFVFYAYYSRLLKLAFLDAFKQIEDYNIIWKHDGPFPEANNVNHVTLAKWLPQESILKHPKTVLFITHGGYNSFLEAASAGVPTLMTPLFFDQAGNAKRAARLGTARILDFHTATSNRVYEEITQMLKDERYTKRAQIISKMLNDPIMSRSEILSAVIERVVKYYYLFPQDKSRQLNLLAYYSIDVIVVVCWGAITILCVILISFKQMLSWLFG